MANVSLRAMQYALGLAVAKQREEREPGANMSALQYELEHLELAIDKGTLSVITLEDCEPGSEILRFKKPKAR